MRIQSAIAATLALAVAGCDRTPAGPSAPERQTEASPLEKAMRAVPPRLRDAHQNAQRCAERQAREAGRRWAPTPATLNAITARLEKDASDTGCGPDDGATSEGGDAAPAAANVSADRP